MNPIISEHILILQEYMKTQRELINLVNNQPTNEFELNTYTVRVQEVENQFNNLSRDLAESIRKISKVE